MLFRYIKRGFFTIFNPSYVISQNVTQDKRVVTDFCHLNARITKNNLVYQLDRDTFSVLRNCKYGVLLVLDIKDAFHSLRLSEDSER